MDGERGHPALTKFLNVYIGTVQGFHLGGGRGAVLPP